MSDKKSEIDASMQRVLQKIQAEMPDVRKTKIAPFGMIDKLMTPKDAIAITYQWIQKQILK